MVDSGMSFPGVGPLSYMYWVDVTGGGVAGYKVEVVVLQPKLAKNSNQDVPTHGSPHTVLAGGAGAVIVI